jgi:hypothetical protein
MLAIEYVNGSHVWHHRTTLSQDAQKGRSARPQRVKGRGVPSGYVEGLNDARTPLADFFSILLEVRRILARGCMPLKAKRGTLIA